MGSKAAADAVGQTAPRILALVTEAWGGYGGIAECMSLAVSALAGLEQHPQIVLLSRHGQHRGASIPGSIRWMSFARRGKVAFGLSLGWSLLAGRRPDLVFCGHLNLLPFARLAARRFASPLIVYLHGIEAWEAPARTVVRKQVGRADRFIAVSALTRERFLEWSGVNQAKVDVIPNAIRTERFGPGARNPELLRRYALQGKRVLMTMCRLDSRQKHKGVDEVIGILPRLLEHHENLTFLVVGGGDDIPRLQEKAEHLGVADHVVFTGWIEDREKADHFRLADAFTLAGHGDGFGIVLLEALACGIPVVASTLDGSGSTVLDGKLGQVVDPGNPQDLQDGILTALASPKRVPRQIDDFSFQAYSRRLAAVVGPMMRSGQE